MYSESKKAAVSHFLSPPNIFFAPHFILKYFSSRLLVLECNFIASFLSRDIFLVPSSSLNTIFSSSVLPRNIYHSPLSSLNITFSHLFLSRNIFSVPFSSPNICFLASFCVEMFLLVRSSPLMIIFPRLFLSRNIFLVPFPLQILFPRLFLSRHYFSQFLSSFVFTISLNHFAILGQCIAM